MILYSLLYSKYTQEPFKPRIADYFKSYKIIDFSDTCKFIEKSNGNRDTIIPNKNNKKKPIFLFGCSFAYGALLEDEQTFAYKLSNITGRDVYNFGISGTGIQYFLYMMEKTNIEKFFPEPEYIIYLFIDNHIFRLYEYFYTDPTPNMAVRYKLQDDKLVYNNPYNILYHFTFFRYLSHNFANKKYNSIYVDTNIELMVKYFKYVKEIASRKFPNSKLVIIKYEENADSEIYNSEKWKELEDMGYIILDTYHIYLEYMFIVTCQVLLFH